MILLLLACIVACMEAHQEADPGALDAAVAAASCVPPLSPELITLCEMDVATAAAQRNDIAAAEASCSRVQAGTWSDECNFVLAEALASQGALEPALAGCSRSGSLKRMCYSHVTSGLRLRVGSPEHPGEVRKQMQALDARVGQALANEDATHRALALDMLRATLWWSVYVGSGSAAPTAAVEATAEHQPYAKTAWAVETLRLLEREGLIGAAAVPVAGQVWAAERGAPAGPRRTMRPMPGLESSQGSVPIIWAGNGASRYVSVDGNDVEVAALDAAGRLGQAIDPRPWLASDDPALRLTAAKVLGAHTMLPIAIEDTEARAAADHARRVASLPGSGIR